MALRTRYSQAVQALVFARGTRPGSLVRRSSGGCAQSLHPAVAGGSSSSTYHVTLIGWLLVAGMSLMVFLLLCMKRCSSPLGYQQEAYWSQYHSNEKTLFQRTAAVHARLLAAENIKTFFGFVALEKEEKEQLAEYQGVSPICSTNWNRVTGVYLYREKNGLPLYSRLNKWATYNLEHNEEAMDKEMDALY